tara:strand:+ start:6793 stop:8187 length:1395 start_codon:yes stop_codon:yes gene_type:complete
MKTQKGINRIIEDHLLKMIIFIQVLVSFIIFFIRSIYYNSIMMGQISYFHAIKTIELTQNLSNLSNYHPYQILLFLLNKLFNNLELISQIIPILLGLATIILLFKTLKQVKIDNTLNFVMCVLITLSPIYIYISTVSNHYILSIFMIILCFYLLTKFKDSNFSLLPFIIIPFLGIFESIFTIILLFTYLIYYKNQKLKQKILVLNFILLILALFIGQVNIDILQNNLFVLKFITSFGAYLGFSVFTLILVIIGIIFTWKNKKRHIPIYLIILFLFFNFLYFGQYSNIFLNFFFCYLSAIALIGLIKYKWNLDVVRDLTFFLLICGILFTSISYTSRLSNSLPNQEIKSEIIKIQDITPSNTIILSDPENGFWIQYFTERKAINNILTKDENIMNTIFMSREYSKSFGILKNYSINFIFITPLMKQKYWGSDEDGLLFLLPYEGRFNNIYTNNDYSVWQVLEEEE